MTARPSPARGWALALVGWTLLTWTLRVPLAWSDAESSTGEKVAATVPVGVFVALAAVAGALVLARRPAGPGAVLVLAGWSVAYWLVRWPLILANDHPAGFLVVHSVLGALAIGLAVGAVVAGRRALSAPGGARDPGGRPGPARR